MIGLFVHYSGTLPIYRIDRWDNGPEHVDSANAVLKAGLVGAGKCLAIVRPVTGSVRAQFRMSRRNVEDLMPAITSPTLTLVLMAVFVYVGRRDLATYSLVAPLLISVGSMTVFVASELMAREQYSQTLEISVACPAPFPVVLFSRIAVVSSLSLIAIAESWLILRFVFGESVTIHHPWVFVAATLLTVFASAGTALITAGLFCLARMARTYQNSVQYPVYLLSGILVPVSVLPDWLEPVRHLIFLYWSANLLRDSMHPAAPAGVLAGLGAIAALGIGSAFVGSVLMVRMLNYLRREGRLGVL